MVFRQVPVEINRDLIMKIYPDIGVMNFKVRPSNRYLGDYYNRGYGYCTFDKFVIKIDERACRVCGRMFRRGTVNKNRKWVYSYPKSDPFEVRLS